MVLGIPQDKTFFYKTLLDINKMSQTLSMNYKKKRLNLQAVHSTREVIIALNAIS